MEVKYRLAWHEAIHFLQAYWYRFLADAKIYEARKNGTDLSESVNKALE